MDIHALLQMHVVGNMNVLNVLTMAAGAIIPIIFGLALPRKNTVGYGRWINRTLGLALLQRRHLPNMPSNIIEIIIANIQTTFQDISFGVYIDARKDLTPEEKQKKVDEYLNTIQP